VACWGCDAFGETTPPAGTFVRVAAGDYHSCGIRTSGEAECWGDGKTVGPGSYGQSLPPPGEFIEIEAGAFFTCGLRPDFRLECWGDVFGHAEDGGSAPALPPCGQFVQMSGWYGGCAVDAESHVQCWRSAAGGFEPRDEPVKQVSVHEDCKCYLYATGESECYLHHWSVWPYLESWIEPWFRGSVTAVSCGRNHACAILDDGTIDCSDTGATFPYTPAPQGTFSEISCGLAYCCGLREDGTAACWGGRYDGDMPPDFPGG
jgi:hypothetical protein